MKKQIITFLIAMSIIGTSFGQSKAQDCRTTVYLSYGHGFYTVIVGNPSSECNSYTIQFFDGTSVRTPTVYSGAKWYYNYTSPLISGSVIVTPVNWVIGNCPFGSVVVNL